jgi:hypothetical protein
MWAYLTLYVGIPAAETILFRGIYGNRRGAAAAPARAARVALTRFTWPRVHVLAGQPAAHACLCHVPSYRVVVEDVHARSVPAQPLPRQPMAGATGAAAATAMRTCEWWCRRARRRRGACARTSTTLAASRPAASRPGTQTDVPVSAPSGGVNNGAGARGTVPWTRPRPRPCPAQPSPLAGGHTRWRRPGGAQPSPHTPPGPWSGPQVRLQQFPGATRHRLYPPAPARTPSSPTEGHL